MDTEPRCKRAWERGNSPVQLHGIAFNKNNFTNSKTLVGVATDCPARYL